MAELPNAHVYLQTAIVALLQVLHGSLTVLTSCSLTHAHAWLWSYGLAVLLSWLSSLVTSWCCPVLQHPNAPSTSIQLCARLDDVRFKCYTQVLRLCLCTHMSRMDTVISSHTLFFVYTRANLHHSTSLMMQRLVLFNPCVELYTRLCCSCTSKVLRAHTC